MTLRTPTVEDAAAIADLCNALTRDLYGEADADEQAVAEWFALPDLGMFLAEHDGRPAGYLDVRCDDEGRRFPVDLRIHPDARGSGVADELLEAAEEWERERAAPGGLSRGIVAERDGEARAAYERRGYRFIRHSFFMEIDLSEHPGPPEWPSGIEVRTFDRERDEQAVFACNQESFADHWDFTPISIERWRTFAFGDRHDPSLWWLAEDGGELAGVCLNSWHYSGDPTFGWIDSLGVRRPWRRHGLGLAFLRHSFLDFKRRGATRVGLGVDGENLTGAVRLYERAGMRAVRRHDTYELGL